MSGPSHQHDLDKFHRKATNPAFDQTPIEPFHKGSTSGSWSGFSASTSTTHNSGHMPGGATYSGGGGAGYSSGSGSEIANVLGWIAIGVIGIGVFAWISADENASRPNPASQSSRPSATPQFKPPVSTASRGTAPYAVPNRPSQPSASYRGTTSMVIAPALVFTAQYRSDIITKLPVGTRVSVLDVLPLWVVIQVRDDYGIWRIGYVLRAKLTEPA